MEISESGDDPRIVSAGGLHFESIQCLGNRVFIKDMGRVMEYHPKEKTYESFAWGNFWGWANGRSHDWGPKRYDPERITWTKSVEDMCNVTWARSELTPDGKRMIVAGDMAELCPNRLNIIDIETRKVDRDIMDLPTLRMPSSSVTTCI
jgi:hypothetical protein